MRDVLVVVVIALALAACGSKGGASEPNETGARCAKGEYFLPGCSDEPGIVAGCYERCAGAEATCGAGLACATVTVMPACALVEGDVACEACGEDVMLCVPAADSGQ